VKFQIGTWKFVGILVTLCGLMAGFVFNEASASRQLAGLTIPVVKRDTLLNGLQILTIEKAGSGQVSFKIRINSGAMFDLAGKGGLADLTAGMLLRGGGGYSASAVEETARQFGIQVKISVDWDGTNIELSGPADARAEMVDLLSRLVLTPTFDQKEFEAVKASRLTALKAENGDFEILLRKAMETIFSVHPYGKPLIGTAESVQQISKFDLVYYHKKFYLANNAMLVVTGDITAEEVTRLARSKLGAMKKGEKAPPSFRPPNPLTGRKVIIVDKPESQTAHAVLAQIGFSRRSPDYLATQVMSIILRNRFEQALSKIGELQIEPRILNGPLLIKLKSPTSEIATHIEKTMQLLASMQATEPSAEQVETAKSQVISAMAEQLNSNPAQVFFDIELYGLGKDYLVTYAERVNAITPVEVLKAAQANLQPKTSSIVIAAPAKLYENEWKKLGEVTVTP
jgi:zinc protease